jgi:hypothetical protein
MAPPAESLTPYAPRSILCGPRRDGTSVFAALSIKKRFPHLSETCCRGQEKDHPQEDGERSTTEDQVQATRRRRCQARQVGPEDNKKEAHGEENPEGCFNHIGSRCEEKEVRLEEDYKEERCKEEDFKKHEADILRPHRGQTLAFEEDH